MEMVKYVRYNKHMTQNEAFNATQPNTHTPEIEHKDETKHITSIRSPMWPTWNTQHPAKACPTQLLLYT